MTGLLVLREQLKSLCGKYEVYLIPVGKFITAMITFIIINSNLGYMEKISKFPLVVILALLCSFLPLNFIIFVAAALVLAHIYALSLECALVVGILFLLMFLLYFRFSPKDTFVVLLTPICCALRIPHVIPLTMGLVGTPASGISVGCGVVIFYVLGYIKECSSALTALDADGMASKFKYLIDGIIGNKSMFVMIAAFAITIFVVYVVRRMNIDHAWTIAIIVGALTNILTLLIGDLMFTTNISLVGTILGSLLAIAFVKCLQFFIFNVDYARTERVQFEDDEYYYYVKAVPKVTIAAPNKTLKKVSLVKNKGETETRSRTSAGRESAGVKRETAGGTGATGVRKTAGSSSVSSVAPEKKREDVTVRKPESRRHIDDVLPRRSENVKKSFTDPLE